MRATRLDKALLITAALVAVVTATACGGQHADSKSPLPADETQAAHAEEGSKEPVGDPNEAPPPKDLLSPKQVASLFSYPRKLTRNDATPGPEWTEKGKIVWAVSYTSGDDTFAPVTMILFEGRYRGMTLSSFQKDLLRRSNLYKDLDYKNGRTGYAMRAAGEGGLSEETAAIPSPRGRFELLVIVDVEGGGPKQTAWNEAYRSLLMEFTVRLMESVAKGIDGIWMKKKP